MPTCFSRCISGRAQNSLSHSGRSALELLKAPCILYNLNGYYDGLKALLEHMIDMGLSTTEKQRGIYFASDLAEIRTILEKA